MSEADRSACSENGGKYGLNNDNLWLIAKPTLTSLLGATSCDGSKARELEPITSRCRWLDIVRISSNIG